MGTHMHTTVEMEEDKKIKDKTLPVFYTPMYEYKWGKGEVVKRFLQVFPFPAKQTFYKLSKLQFKEDKCMHTKILPCRILFGETCPI